MRRTHVCIILVFFVALFGPGPLAAAEADDDPRITVQLEVPRDVVTVGEPFGIEVRVNGSRSPSRPRFGESENLRLEYVSGRDETRTTLVIINNRKQEERYEGYVFNYRGIATEPGEITIPPAEVDVGGQTYTTRAASVRAREPRSTGEVTLAVTPETTTAYVGQPIEVTFRWVSALPPKSVQLSDLGDSDTFDVLGAPPPEAPERLITRIGNHFGSDTRAYYREERVDGRSAHVIEFRKYFVPERAGTLSLGPFSLTTDVIVRRSRSVFERDATRRHSVLSDTVTIEVRSLPETGRPPGFTGLVGKYSISTSARPREVNVGDPIELTVRVRGPLLERMEAPELASQPEFAAKFRVSEEVEEVEERDAPRDARLFEYTIRATDAGVSTIPALELPYFDTGLGAYVVARSKPIPLNVRATRVVTAEDAAADGSGMVSGAETVEDATRGIMHNYETVDALRPQATRLGEMIRSPAAIAALAAPPGVFGACLVAAIVTRRRGRERTGTPKGKAYSGSRSLLRRARESDPAEVASLVSRALTSYVSLRAGRGEVSLTAEEAAAMLPESAPELRERLRAILDRCDATRFGGLAGSDAGRLVEEAAALLADLHACPGRFS